MPPGPRPTPQPVLLQIFARPRTNFGMFGFVSCRFGDGWLVCGSCRIVWLTGRATDEEDILCFGGLVGFSRARDVRYSLLIGQEASSTLSLLGFCDYRVGPPCPLGAFSGFAPQF